MSGNPWHKRYHSNALSGYMALTLEERGAYTTLLDMLYDRGEPIMDNERLIAGYLGVSVRKARAVIESLAEKGKIRRLPGGLLTNDRFEKERENDAKTARKLSENGSKGGRVRAEKAKYTNKNNDSDQAELDGSSSLIRSQKPEPDKSSVDTNVSTGAAAPLDPAKVMFDHGRALLTAAGKSSDQAGQLLGKWRKAHGAEAVITALGRAQREGAIDPVAFIEGCLKSAAKNKQADGEMFGAFGRLRELG